MLFSNVLLQMLGAWSALIMISRHTYEWRQMAMQGLTVLDLRYVELRKAVLRAANRGLWPDKLAHRKLSRGLMVNETRIVPRFFAQHGPLQVSAFFANNLAAVDIFEEARKAVFQPFVEEVLTAIGSGDGFSDDAVALRERVAKGVHWADRQSLHLVLTVFSEHPSLLEGEDRRRWRPVSDESIEALGARLLVELDASSPRALRAPMLTLQGYCITKDGTMIAAFDEETVASRTTVTELRRRVAAIGRLELGRLNSRPKDLIHVSLGRFLSWPDAIDDEAMGRVGKVVAKYTNAFAKGVHPNDQAQKLPRVGEVVTLTEVELVRDVRWMMNERKVFRQFALTPPSPQQREQSSQTLSSASASASASALIDGDALRRLAATALTSAIQFAMELIGWLFIVFLLVQTLSSQCPRLFEVLEQTYPSAAWVIHRFSLLHHPRANLPL